MGSKCVVRQAGVIPYRVRGEGVEVLLVSRRGGRGWVVPKGHVEDGLSAPESARNEALEEAGAVGIVEEPPVGWYRYRKRGRDYEVALYAMEVVRLRPVWMEMEERERAWARVEEAAGIVAYDGLAECLRAVGEWVGVESAAA